MFTDIFLICVFTASLVLGYRKGFTASLFHSFGWLGSCVLAYILDGRAGEFLKARTGIYENIFQAVTQNAALNRGASEDMLPGLFDEALNRAEDTLVTAITDTVFSVLCFLLTLLAVKILLGLLYRIFSKKKKAGIIGVADGLLGALAGAVRGAVIVLLLLAFACPLLSFISPDLAASLMENLQASHFSLWLYEHNPLLTLLAQLSL